MTVSISAFSSSHTRRTPSAPSAARPKSSQPPDPNRGSAKSEGFDYVRAPPDSAIQDDRHVARHRIDNGGKLVQGCRKPLKSRPP